MKLTASEREALRFTLNLADAHTHQSPSDGEVQEIWSRLPDIAEGARLQPQADVDARAFDAFHTVSGQHTALEWCDWLPCYSASLAVEIVANAFRGEYRRMYMVEPTFDCLADIMRRNGLSLEAVVPPDRADSMEELNYRVQERPAPVFLVTPNNPTGGVIDGPAFARIAKTCRQMAVPLVVDVSFRLFDERARYDMYALLRAAEVEFAVIEDTGKTWPTLDLKMAFLNCSPSVYRDVLPIYEDLLLNVSSFTSALVAEYAEYSVRDGLRSVRKLIAQNRSALRALIREEDWPVRVAYPDSQISVEVLRLPREVRADDVVGTLRTDFDVAVLPMTPFYWSGSGAGQDSIRVALARTSDAFDSACAQLGRGLRELLGSGRTE